MTRRFKKIHNRQQGIKNACKRCDTPLEAKAAYIVGAIAERFWYCPECNIYSFNFEENDEQ